LETQVLESTPLLFGFFAFTDMLNKLTTYLKRVSELSFDKAFILAVNEEVKKEIIRLNTRDQLFDKGQDSLGNSLGTYRPFTITRKQERGQPFEFVTLFWDGDFYKSFRVFVDRSNLDIIIEADGAEKDDKDLRDVYGEDIIGLNPENLQIIIDMILKNIRTYLKGKLAFNG